MAALDVSPDKGVAQVKNLVALRDKYRSAMVRPTSAKIFADGVVESHTAALFEPYVDRPDSKGILNFTQENFNAIATELDRNGFQVHVHAIGDKAINEALNAFAEVRKKNGMHDSRHQIAHLEVVDPADIPRFRELGVVANVQAFWAYNDRYMSECTVPVLGPKRSERLYPIHSLMKSGAVVAAGSDWSVSSMNPLDAIEVAVTRCGPDEKDRKPWIPAERADLEQIIASYTICGAYANHEERDNGSLEVGKQADFVVLDRSLFAVAPDQIHKTRVMWTFLNGKPVYKSDDAPNLVRPNGNNVP